MKRLPGLDFIRIYAAVSVVIFHVIYSPQAWFGYPLFVPELRFFFLHGTDAVVLFFVLSGWIITYLLLNEKQQNGQISVRQFYRRRILRIWPLYYTIVTVGLLVLPAFLPHTPFPAPSDSGYVVLLVFFFANLTGPVTLAHYLAHLWSISVEEQFYAFYPLVVRFVRHLPAALIAIFILRWAAFYAASFLNNQALRTVFLYARFDAMAVGALAAYLAFNRHRLLSIVYHPIVQVSTIAGFLLNLIYHPLGTEYEILRLSIFAIYITNVATNPRAIGRIDSRLTHAFGKLSYAIYMIHPLVLYSLLVLTPSWTALEILIGTCIITLAIGVGSYRWLESPFLRRKDGLVSTTIARKTFSR